MSVSAKYFRARIGSTIIQGTARFNTKVDADRLDATDAESNGFTNTDCGCLDAELTLEGNHIVGGSVFPTIGPGAVLTNLRVYMQSPSGSTLTGEYWNFPSAEVVSGTSGGEVRGKLSFSLVVKNKGTFSFVGS